MDVALIFEYDYSSCKLTNDGKLYLSDRCLTTSRKQSESEIISQLFEYWNQYYQCSSTQHIFNYKTVITYLELTGEGRTCSHNSWPYEKSRVDFLLKNLNYTYNYEDLRWFD